MEVLKKHPQWKYVLETCRVLQKSGYQAWLAGGCVRDGLLGIAPNDFDIATDARPEIVETLFEKTVGVGKAFGVIVLPFKEFQIEIATFRYDGEYTDGRRPENVVFCTPEEDAMRRDFTVNALFFDVLQEEVVDYVGGREDLSRKVLRAVGDPRTRFAEDHLRILRAFRFAGQLEFEVEESTYEAAKEMSDKVTEVSGERIRQEFEKLFTRGKRVYGLEYIYSSGVFKSLFPHAKKDLKEWGSLKKELSLLEKGTRLNLIWSLFFIRSFSPIHRDEFEKNLGFLKFSRQDQKEILKLADLISSQSIWSQKRKGERLDSWAKWGRETDYLDIVKLGLASDALKEDAKIVFSKEGMPVPFLKSSDLKAAAIPQGPLWSDLLKEAYYLQLEGTLQSRDDAFEWLRQNSQRS